MNVAIILAGGKGVRMGLNIPKQFVEVLGKPIIAYTLDIFQQHQEIDAVDDMFIEGIYEYIGENSDVFTKAEYH